MSNIVQWYILKMMFFQCYIENQFFLVNNPCVLFLSMDLEHAKEAWDEWDIHCLILLSLSLQLQATARSLAAASRQ
jgi:hypothetical protein